MTPEYQNLKQYLEQPGQTVMDLMRKFNKKRMDEGRPCVSNLTFYSWCRGDAHPTKDWDKNALAELTGLTAEQLYADVCA